MKVVMRAVMNGSGLAVGVVIVDLATAIDDVGLGLVQETGNEMTRKTGESQRSRTSTGMSLNFDSWSLKGTHRRLKKLG